MSKLIASVLIALVAAPAVANELRTAIAQDYEKNLQPLFVHLHANPELSHREFETSKRLASELSAMGYQVTTGIGKTGVVAVLANGKGPTVLLRADMDGLPIEEKSGLPYASKARQVDIDGKEQPVMHACGHDVHVTALVGAARQLMTRRNEWSGTLVLIGQPAEERVSGARDMLADGLYTTFPKPEYAVAFHVSSKHPSGKVQVPQTIAYSSTDSVDVIVHGIGTHGASPHAGIDPILIASQIVVSLQSVVSRSINPLQPGVITVGAIHGGTKHNIISDRVEMQLTVRSDDHAVREQLLDGIDRIVAGVAKAHGVPEDKMPEVVRSKTETAPPTINHQPTAQRIKAAFEKKLGKDMMVEQAREGMGAEDFAYFVAPEHNVKGVYFAVGGTPPTELKSAAAHHSPLFKIEPAPAIKSGTEAMVVAAMTLMPR